MLREAHEELRKRMASIDGGLRETCKVERNYRRRPQAGKGP